jgi:hypothetical protein
VKAVGWRRAGDVVAMGEGRRKWSDGLVKEEKELWVAPVAGGVMSNGGARRWQRRWAWRWR